MLDVMNSPAERAKQAGRLLMYPLLSYAVGAVLFVGYVLVAIQVESHERAKRTK